MLRYAMCLLSLLVSGCGASDERSSEIADAAAALDAKPAPPTGDNDADYLIEEVRQWYAIGNSLTGGHDTIQIAVTAPDEVETIDAWIDDLAAVRLVPQSGRHLQVIDISMLAAGEHEIMLAADGADTAFARLHFKRSHPLYVVVSTDWDYATVRNDSLDRQQELHDWHSELRLTHFVGPYTFTDSSVTSERAQALADWVRNMRDTYNDEIGLHVHPYCNFVETTDVTCRSEPSFTSSSGDTTGYTVILASYTEEEQATLFAAAAEIFERNGLGRPTSFRAGGWSADIATLRALETTGYVADTSANNWARMEEWADEPGTTLYEWNQEHWATIGDTSQPYYPNREDILSDAAPQVSVLEVPDNGILVEYITAEEMIEVFDLNFPGEALQSPTMYQIGFHPGSFSEDDQTRIHTALVHVDQHRLSRGEGPVVYATLSELVQVWPPPQ